MTITSIGIIGAGTMGNGIAQVAASAGYDVVLLDVSDAALEKGLAALSNSLDRLIKKEVMNAEQKSQTLARIKTTTHYADLAQVSLVIEAPQRIKPSKNRSCSKSIRWSAKMPLLRATPHPSRLRIWVHATHDQSVLLGFIFLIPHP